MSKDWASTFVEIITYPASKITDAIDDIAGTPEHKRFSNIAKKDVFQSSHLRDLDKTSPDNTLKIGNVMRVPRDGYWHYGIYSGNDHAIHFTSKDSDASSDNRVMETRVSKFIRNARNIEVLGFPNQVNGKAIYTMKKTCSRARSQIGRGDYSIFNNNCQHFALWCKTGLAFSGQTFLVNGGVSDSYTAAFLNGIDVLKHTKVPDVLFIHGITISRVVLASDYTTL